MELRHLEHFVAVAEELHFTRAAHRLGLAQSAVSASIRALESELATTLFHRTTQRVTLTETGSVLLVEARRTLAAARAARESVEAVQGMVRGTLRVGVLQRFHGPIDVPALVGTFAGHHPGIDVRIIQSSTVALREQIRVGALDVAFIVAVDPSGDGVDVIRLGEEGTVLACPDGHPLAARDSVALTELDGAIFVDFQSDWGSRILLDRMMAQLRVTRRSAIQVNDVDTLVALVRGGLGVAVVARNLAARATEGVRFVEIDGPAPRSILAVAVPSGGPGSAAGARFLELVLDQAATSAPDGAAGRATDGVVGGRARGDG